MILAIVLYGGRGPGSQKFPGPTKVTCDPENRVKKAQALSPGEGKGSIVSLEKGSWS